VTAMVGLLTALPQTRLYQRLQREGRLLGETTGNNTAAVLNFVPRLNRQFLVSGYRQLMQVLYEPKSYYQRILVFLERHRPQGPTIGLSWPEFKAFLKSLWLIGVRHRGRRAFWLFLTTVQLCHPRQVTQAVTLAIYGYHFRRVAAEM
jgi:hypothetical protein